LLPLKRKRRNFSEGKNDLRSISPTPLYGNDRKVVAFSRYISFCFKCETLWLLRTVFIKMFIERSDLIKVIIFDREDHEYRSNMSK
jgi:hypothetical protein